jgi:hypothetical protein
MWSARSAARTNDIDNEKGRLYSCKRRKGTNSGFYKVTDQVPKDWNALHWVPAATDNDC